MPPGDVADRSSRARSGSDDTGGGGSFSATTRPLGLFVSLYENKGSGSGSKSSRNYDVRREEDDTEELINSGNSKLARRGKSCNKDDPKVDHRKRRWLQRESMKPKEITSALRSQHECDGAIAAVVASAARDIKVPDSHSKKSWERTEDGANEEETQGTSIKECGNNNQQPEKKAKVSLPDGAVIPTARRLEEAQREFGEEAPGSKPGCGGKGSERWQEIELMTPAAEVAYQRQKTLLQRNCNFVHRNFTNQINNPSPLDDVDYEENPSLGDATHHPSAVLAATQNSVRFFDNGKSSMPPSQSSPSSGTILPKPSAEKGCPKSARLPITSEQSPPRLDCRSESDAERMLTASESTEGIRGIPSARSPSHDHTFRPEEANDAVRHVDHCGQTARPDLQLVGDLHRSTVSVASSNRSHFIDDRIRNKQTALVMHSNPSPKPPYPLGCYMLRHSAPLNPFDSCDSPTTANDGMVRGGSRQVVSSTPSCKDVVQRHCSLFDRHHETAKGGTAATFAHGSATATIEAKDPETRLSFTQIIRNKAEYGQLHVRTSSASFELHSSSANPLREEEHEKAGERVPRGDNISHGDATNAATVSQIDPLVSMDGDPVLGFGGANSESDSSGIGVRDCGEGEKRLVSSSAFGTREERQLGHVLGQQQSQISPSQRHATATTRSSGGDGECRPDESGLVLQSSAAQTAKDPLNTTLSVPASAYLQPTISCPPAHNHDRRGFGSGPNHANCRRGFIHSDFGLSADDGPKNGLCVFESFASNHPNRTSVEDPSFAGDKEGIKRPMSAIARNMRVNKSTLVAIQSNEAPMTTVRGRRGQTTHEPSPLGSVWRKVVGVVKPYSASKSSANEEPQMAACGNSNGSHLKSADASCRSVMKAMILSRVSPLKLVLSFRTLVVFPVTLALLLGALTSRDWRHIDMTLHVMEQRLSSRTTLSLFSVQRTTETTSITRGDGDATAAAATVVELPVSYGKLAKSASRGDGDPATNNTTATSAASAATGGGRESYCDAERQRTAAEKTLGGLTLTQAVSSDPLPGSSASPRVKRLALFHLIHGPSFRDVDCRLLTQAFRPVGIQTAIALIFAVISVCVELSIVVLHMVSTHRFHEAQSVLDWALFRSRKGLTEIENRGKSGGNYSLTDPHHSGWETPSVHEPVTVMGGGCSENGGGRGGSGGVVLEESLSSVAHQSLGVRITSDPTDSVGAVGNVGNGEDQQGPLGTGMGNHQPRRGNLAGEIRTRHNGMTGLSPAITAGVPAITGVTGSGFTRNALPCSSPTDVMAAANGGCSASRLPSPCFETTAIPAKAETVTATAPYPSSIAAAPIQVSPTSATPGMSSADVCWAPVDLSVGSRIGNSSQPGVGHSRGGGHSGEYAGGWRYNFRSWFRWVPGIDPPSAPNGLGEIVGRRENEARPRSIDTSLSHPCVRDRGGGGGIGRREPRPLVFPPQRVFLLDSGGDRSDRRRGGWENGDIAAAANRRRWSEILWWRPVGTCRRLTGWHPGGIQGNDSSSGRSIYFSASLLGGATLLLNAHTLICVTIAFVIWAFRTNRPGCLNEVVQMVTCPTGPGWYYLCLAVVVVFLALWLNIRTPEMCARLSHMRKAPSPANNVSDDHRRPTPHCSVVVSAGDRAARGRRGSVDGQEN